MGPAAAGPGKPNSGTLLEVSGVRASCDGKQRVASAQPPDAEASVKVAGVVFASPHGVCSIVHHPRQKYLMPGLDLMTTSWGSRRRHTKQARALYKYLRRARAQTIDRRW